MPGSREWLSGSLQTRLADRSLVTTFFRPDRTIGVWAIGEPVADLFYRAMIGNGFNTSDLSPPHVDTQFVYSASMWKCIGDYGQGFSDLEWHDSPAAQFGHSLTFSSNSDSSGAWLDEQGFVRLSDGTSLSQIGALSPGVTVNHFDTYLYALDAAFKYRGFSFNSEYYLRWLQSIEGDGPLPISQNFDHGFYAEGGYFLIPRMIEANCRVSQIFGQFGDAHEFAGGINWFINGAHTCKFTFDVSKLNQSPVENSGTNYRAGDDGVMFRSQLQVAF